MISDFLSYKCEIIHLLAVGGLRERLKGNIEEERTNRSIGQIIHLTGAIVCNCG